MPRGQMQHIELTVNDLVRSAAFYGDVLGVLGYRRLKIDMEVALWQVDFEDGTHCTVGLRQAPHHAEAGRVRDGLGEGLGERTGEGLGQFAWAANNRGEVDRLHVRLKEIGARILSPPAVHPQFEPGYYAVFYADPDWLKLSLVHAPRST